MRLRFLYDQWFLVGVALLTGLTLWNPANLAVAARDWMGSHYGNEATLALLFILSGLELHADHLLEALRDWRGVLLAMASTFILAPIIGWLLAKAAPSPAVALGLLIVGVVSSTQASGIVMSTLAGGRTAHALIICLLSNLLCIFTIPSQLSLMITTQKIDIHLPWLSMILKLAGLILVPLLVGMAARHPLQPLLRRLPFKLNVLSRVVVLGIVFIGLCQGRESIFSNAGQILPALILAVIFHSILATVLWLTLKALHWGPGRRESVFLMGIQKTLPQAIWLQTTYFPAFGMALVVCVLYHISQLIMDSWFVGRLAAINRSLKEIKAPNAPGAQQS
jgi:sodium/bile acid cotransporter 7